MKSLTIVKKSKKQPFNPAQLRPKTLTHNYTIDPERGAVALLSSGAPEGYVVISISRRGNKATVTYKLCQTTKKAKKKPSSARCRLPAR